MAVTEGNMAMKTLTAAELARNLSRVLDRLEHDGEEMIIVRDNRPIGRLVPTTIGMTVDEAFGDLYGILSDEEGEAWLRDMKGFDRNLAQFCRKPGSFAQKMRDFLPRNPKQ